MLSSVLVLRLSLVYREEGPSTVFAFAFCLEGRRYGVNCKIGRGGVSGTYWYPFVCRCLVNGPTDSPTERPHRI